MSKRKTPFWIYFIFPSIILFFAVIQLITSMVKNNKIDEEISSSYKRLTLDDQINNRVISAYYPQGRRGGGVIQHVKLESGENYTIWVKKNLYNDDIYFGEIIKTGVFLKKESGSDTLTLIVNNNKFKYLIQNQNQR